MEDKDRLLELIRRSLSIRKHVDFFRWLQDEVRHLLPHQLLVAAWGDFPSRRLSFDVASAIPGIRTQDISGDCGIASLMVDLYSRWRDMGEACYAINNFDFAAQAGNLSVVCLEGLKRMRSVAVHGIRDKRGMNDCLYAFFDTGGMVGADRSTLDLLMPFIDAALRRVEHLTPVPAAADPPKESMVGISGREREVMTWLMVGKTNEEISMILGISPNTVKNHLKRIYRKLDVFSRAQAVAKYALIARPTAWAFHGISDSR